MLSRAFIGRSCCACEAAASRCMPLRLQCVYLLLLTSSSSRCLCSSPLQTPPARSYGPYAAIQRQQGWQQKKQQQQQAGDTIGGQGQRVREKGCHSSAGAKDGWLSGWRQRHACQRCQQQPREHGYEVGTPEMEIRKDDDDKRRDGSLSDVDQQNGCSRHPFLTSAASP
ncbi:hypothetical protein cyc_00819 [Cyclospora cayetanensis]|uniref:Uncharacterized protein n=1 Tax=Cyclospora cayetanensis TaxID=88456 RepID=A0A1D3CT32_9EIME|nr:hypothetical protein cyc_00819 [Cyclospora cayetanensis]